MYAIEKISLVVKNISVIINSVEFKNILEEVLNVLQAHLVTSKMEDIVKIILFAKTNI